MHDDLVKRLRAAAIMSEALSIFLPHSEGSAVAKLYNEAADAIEELEHHVFLADLACKAEAAKAPRWIPVSERLPIRDDAVLCIGDNGISIADYVVGDKWCALPWFFVDGEQETGVTHWMPLPELPEEE